MPIFDNMARNDVVELTIEVKTLRCNDPDIIDLSVNVNDDCTSDEDFRAVIDYRFPYSFIVKESDWTIKFEDVVFTGVNWFDDTCNGYDACTHCHSKFAMQIIEDWQNESHEYND